jgi:hypothetical protein
VAASYVSQTKKQWMTLDVTNENYAAQYTAALGTVDKAISVAKDSERDMLRGARAELTEFDVMSLTNKHGVQRRLKASQYSGRFDHKLRHLSCLHQ